MDALSAARALLPIWLPFVPFLALPLGFLAGWLVRRRTRFAAVMVSSVAGALFVHLGGPLSLIGAGVTGFLGSAAALAGYALGRRRAPPPPPGRIAGRVALVAASVLVLVAAQIGRLRALPAVSRRSPLAAVVVTGGEAWALSDLSLARAAGGRPEDAVVFYRAAFVLDGRPSHLANATFVESGAGRCSAARGFADEAVRAAQKPGVTEWDRHLAARASEVSKRCTGAGPAVDQDR